jgi:hypothetical protein
MIVIIKILMFKARVFFGNNNSVVIMLSASTVAGELVAAISQCINVKFDEILCIVFNGILVCRDNFDKPLYAFNLVDTSCNIFVILQYRGQVLTHSDRIIQEQNRYWLLEHKNNIAARLKITYPTALASTPQATADTEQLVDVPIVIPATHLERYISTCDMPGPIGTEPHECSICYETQTGERVIMHCGHIFHRECISRWLTEKSVRCPVCNCDVRDFVPSEYLLS